MTKQTPPQPELTDEQAAVLEEIDKRTKKPLYSNALHEMLKRDYCLLVQPYEHPGPPYDITEAGRAALKAYQEREAK